MQGYGAVLESSISKDIRVAGSKFRQRLLAF